MSSIGQIHWHEGLFLRPQHFQQNDLFFLERMHQTAGLFNPTYWGVESMRIAVARLSAQVFEIEQCVLIFQDGTRVEFPRHACLIQRSFENAWAPNATRMSVFVGLRKLSPGQNNMTPSNALIAQDLTARVNQARYAEGSIANNVTDFFSSENGEAIATLSHNIQLFFGKESDDAAAFDLIKIAEVVRNGSDVRIVEDYLPPVTKIKSSPLLHKWLRDLKEQLTSKARELALHKGDRVNESNLGQRELFYLLSLQTLNRFVPILHHRIEEGDISPRLVYEYLLQLTGELSTFSFKYDLFGGNESGGEPVLGFYDHTALAPSFRKVIHAIGAIMDEITAGPDFMTAMVFDGTYFYSDVSTRIFQGQNRYFLHVKTDLAADVASNVMANYAKIASRELLPILVARSLAGIPLEYVTVPPSVLPRTARSHYFEIVSHADVWTSVKEMQNIAVYLDNPPADMEIELMVIYG